VIEDRPTGCGVYKTARTTEIKLKQNRNNKYEYECRPTVDQKLTSHAYGGLADSRRTLQQRAAVGRDITPWPPF